MVDQLDKALFDPPTGDDFPDLTMDRLVMELASYRDHVSRWWTTRRDVKLRDLARGNDYTLSALNTAILKLSGIPMRVQARNMQITAHQELAEQMDGLLASILPMLLPRFLFDLLTQDNGAFAVVVGQDRDASRPLVGLPTGILFLDSQHCVRTGHHEWPVRYRHRENDGSEKWYRLHASRLIEMAEMRSPDRDMHGVGFCFMSRAIQTAQTMLDSVVLEQEVKGSRPATEIIHGEGFSSPDILKDAFRKAAVASDNAGLSIHSARVYLATPVGGKVTRIPLRMWPDGYNKEQDLTLGMYVLAMAMGMDARELWPATQSGATKADASVQHMKAQAKLPSWWIRNWTQQIEEKFLPPSLRLISDYTDDEQDATRSEIRNVRATRRERDLATGVTSVRLEREQMLHEGELSQDEFESLELADGRTPDGLPVRVLFAVPDNPLLAELLAVTEDPVNVPENERPALLPVVDRHLRAAEAVAYRGSVASQKQAGRLAIAALSWLKREWEGEGEEESEGETENVSRETPIADKARPEDWQDRIESTWAEWVREITGQGYALKETGESEIAQYLSDYETDILAFAEQLGRGDIEPDYFAERLENVARSMLLMLFLLGSGRSADEVPEEAQRELDAAQVAHRESAAGLAQDIADGHYQDGETQGERRRRRMALRHRVRLWMNQARSLFTLGQLYDPRDPFLRWRYGPTEHCEDCIRLNGQVHRASGWRAAGWRPRSRRLECGGWWCQCRFERVDGPESGDF